MYSKSLKVPKRAFFLIIMLLTFNLFSQHKNSTKNVYINKNGVMIWSDSNKEVKGFGVNYSTPFAHAYRQAIKMGIDPKKAIDNDIYHLSRLGFDLYRLHVWDTEISDIEGNLIENKNLDTFDYLIAELKKKGFNFIITPIAFWGNGWPEPNEKTPGFSHKYGKEDCLTNPEAIKAQENYLEQFLNHINPYTNIAYKNEPNIIAFEVSNEPHHTGKPKDITKFVKGMIDAMKKTGTKKPIFYNMSHGVHFTDAYFKGGAQGGTFQWYPTGLGYNRELSGNLLPNVSNYNIPFEDIIKKHKGAKLVYEFDAADVGRSYIYPAMARSFRTAGIQLAAHFAYDPTYLAPHNTEYDTHYMNLVYAPQKAISLKICSEIFHEIPMYKEFGVYPENSTFDSFKVDYENDLAEYNSVEKFFYTNSTNSIPKNEAKLKEIVGSENSLVVKYDGSGAYFLDKINDGIWRLEVLPDAIWVDNLFGQNSTKKIVAVVNWQEHKMNINLSNLGLVFNLEGINEGNSHNVKVTDGSFKITPGTYMLCKKGMRKKWKPTDDFKFNKLNDFYAPKTTVYKPWFKHIPNNEIIENTPIKIKVQFIAPKNPKEIRIVGYSNPKNYFNIKMEYLGNYQYSVIIPANKFEVGYLNYNIIVSLEDDTKITYPAAKEGDLYDWDFYDRASYKIPIVSKNNPIYLFKAFNDTDLLVKQWKSTFKLVPTKKANEAEYQMNLDQLFYPDIENLDVKPIYDYSFKHFVLDKIVTKKEILPLKKNLIFYGRSLNNKPCKLQIALVMNDGSAFGKVIEIGTETKNYIIPIRDLVLVKTVTLPRPYPSFLPYYFKHNNNSKFDITKVESVQFSIGSQISESELKTKHGIGVISIYLE